MDEKLLTPSWLLDRRNVLACDDFYDQYICYKCPERCFELVSAGNPPPTTACRLAAVRACEL